MRVTVLSIRTTCSEEMEIQAYTALVSPTGTICGMRKTTMNKMEMLQTWFGSFPDCHDDIASIQRPYFHQENTLIQDLECFVKRILPHVQLLDYEKHCEFFEDVISYTEIEGR